MALGQERAKWRKIKKRKPPLFPGASARAATTKGENSLSSGLFSLETQTEGSDGDCPGVETSGGPWEEGWPSHGLGRCPEERKARFPVDSTAGPCPGQQAGAPSALGCFHFFGS